MQPILVISNPHANRGRMRQRRAQVERALVSGGVPYVLADTLHPGHAALLAQHGWADGYATIAVVGGDGTISEVVNGLMASVQSGYASGQPTLAVFPGGSGNDFAAEAGFAVADEIIAARIAGGNSRSIDIGRVRITSRMDTRTHYFNNSLGIGLEAATTMQAAKMERLSGVLLYAVAAVRALLQFEPVNMEISYQQDDGQTQTLSGPMIMVTVGNSRRTGGGFYLTPQAALDDGLLDMGVAMAISKIRLLVLLPQALYGKHINDPAFVLRRSSNIQLQCAGGVPVHADGELLSAHAHKIEIDVLPGCLRIVA